MPVPLNLTQLFTNNAVSLLTAPISATATSLNLMAGHGADFPQPVGDGSDFFFVTLEDQAATVREIIKVTGRTGDTLTFSLADRGQEGTVPRAWTSSAGADTLVDHRITAETMRRVMMLPVDTAGGITGVGTQKDGATVGAPATTYNFTGAGVTVTGAGATKTIDIPASGGPGGSTWINGQNTLSTNIDQGWQLPISVAAYGATNRSFKFMVTVTHSTSHFTRAFEVMLTISGDLGANAEVVHATQYAAVGPKVEGDLHALVNTGTKTMSLEWQNTESQPVTVHVTRIQHFPV